MRKAPWMILALLPLATTACVAADGQRSGIVVTTDILGDITQSIVGDETEVTVLMEAGSDPHSFGVSAKQAAALEQAELVIHNGLGLEEGVSHHVDAAKATGVPTFAVAEAVDPIEYTDGRTAGESDPHFWTDPVRVAEAVDAIARHITDTVTGVDARAIDTNAADYRSEIETLHEHNTEVFGAMPAADRKLVTNHHVFGYLAKRYDFTVIGAVVPSGSTLASPSSADLKELADAVREADVRAIFVDSSQPDKLAKAMAAETGIDIEVIPLYSESLTGEDGGAATFLAMSRANTRAIAAGLG